MDEKTLHLKGEQVITFQISEEKEKGTFKGVAYSGKPVKNHGGFVNMVIDLDSIDFKEEVPVLRDHDISKYIGKARLYKEDNQLKVEGKLFSKSQLGKEVRDLAEDGANWELSVGLGYAEIESIKENEEIEVNGFIQKGPANIIKAPRVSEVSFVAIGADTSAFAEVFNQKNKEIKEMEIDKIEFTKEEWENFACACGGSKESKLSEVEQKLKDEKEKMEAEIEELKKELKKYKDLAKKKKLSQVLEDKGLVLSDEKIESLVSDEIKFESYLEFLSDLPKKEERLIDPKFTEVVTPVEKVMDSKERQKLAAEMVNKGEAKNIVEALKRI